MNLHLQSEIKCEKMSSATLRRHLSKDDKLAIIEASKSPGFSKEDKFKGDSRYTGSDNEDDDFNDKGFIQYN